MTIQIDGETYLSATEACAKLQVSRTTLDTLVKRGQLQRYRQGIRRLTYYKLSELERLLEFKESTDD